MTYFEIINFKNMEYFMTFDDHNQLHFAPFHDRS